MQRKNIYVRDDQVRSLKQLRQETGMTASELIRRLLDDYFKRQADYHAPPPPDEAPLPAAIVTDIADVGFPHEIGWSDSDAPNTAGEWRDVAKPG
jgi:hypothetical protein